MPERLTEEQIAALTAPIKISDIGGAAIDFANRLGEFEKHLRAAYAELDATRQAGEWKPTHRHTVRIFAVKLIGEVGGQMLVETADERFEIYTKQEFDVFFEPIPLDAPGEKEKEL